jgi:hypothetical protein
MSPVIRKQSQGTVEKVYFSSSDSEMDPTREFIKTNEFWDVEGLKTRLIQDSTFQTLKTRMEVLSSEEETIWRMQL